MVQGLDASGVGGVGTSHQRDASWAGAVQGVVGEVLLRPVTGLAQIAWLLSGPLKLPQVMSLGYAFAARACSPERM